MWGEWRPWGLDKPMVHWKWVDLQRLGLREFSVLVCNYSYRGVCTAWIFGPLVGFWVYYCSVYYYSTRMAGTKAVVLLLPQQSVKDAHKKCTGVDY